MCRREKIQTPRWPPSTRKPTGDPPKRWRMATISNLGKRKSTPSRTLPKTSSDCRPNGLDFLPFPEPRTERDARTPLLARAHDAPRDLFDRRLGPLPPLVDAAHRRRARVV